MGIPVQAIGPLLLALGATAANLLPAVTPVPFGREDSCVGWPGWLEGSTNDLTQPPLTMYVRASGDPGLDDMRLSELLETSWRGSASPDNTWRREPSTLTRIAASIERTNFAAIQTFRCVKGVFGLYNEADANIRVYPDRNHGYMMYNLEGADPTVPFPVRLYSHEIDGEEQPGRFVGAEGNTTWGFRYVRPTAEDCPASGNLPPPYWEATLQGLPILPNVEPTASYEPMIYGFIELKRDERF